MSLVVALFLAAAPEPVAADDTDRTALRTILAAALDRDDRRGKLDVPPDTSPAVKKWLAVHEKSLGEARRSRVLAEQPWGFAAEVPGPAGVAAPLHLYVLNWHSGGRLVVYGLVGGVDKAYLLSDAAKSALPGVRVGNSTVFTVPRQAPDALGTVVVVEWRGKPETVSLAVRPNADGRIQMHARDAMVFGRTLRFEPEPHKDTLGYWTDPADYATWQFDVDKPGEYAAEILQGCGTGSGGSDVNFAVGEQVLKVMVVDTGGFQKFVARDIGRFRFEAPGRYTLAVKPVRKPGVAVMDLRQVTLTRVEK